MRPSPAVETSPTWDVLCSSVKLLLIVSTVCTAFYFVVYRSAVASDHYERTREVIVARIQSERQDAKDLMTYCRKPGAPPSRIQEKKCIDMQHILNRDDKNEMAHRLMQHIKEHETPLISLCPNHLQDKDCIHAMEVFRDTVYYCILLLIVAIVAVWHWSLKSAVKTAWRSCVRLKRSRHDALPSTVTHAPPIGHEKFQ